MSTSRTIAILLAGLAVSAPLAAQVQPADDRPQPVENILLISDGVTPWPDKYVKLALSVAPELTENRVVIARPDQAVQIADEKFGTIVLQDVKQLNRTAVAALEERVRSGVGICLFIGPRANGENYNKNLYREGAGILPAPLGEPVKLAARTVDDEADFSVDAHPALALLQDDIFRPMIVVRRYRAIRKGWIPGDDKKDGVRIVARTRDGAAFIIEKPYGKGRVIVVLVSPTEKWTDWPKDYSWLPTINALQDYLALERRSQERPKSQE